MLPCPDLACRAGQWSKKNAGFTLLEVMIAMAIIVIVLVAAFGSQSQGLSLANEAKFNTTASLLAQAKIAEIMTQERGSFASDSGDFGEDFADYRWEVTVSDVGFAGAEAVADHLKRIDVGVTFGEHGTYHYRLRLYRFVPRSES